MVGEMVHEDGVFFRIRIDLIEIGAGEECSKDFTIAADSKVLDPCIVGKLVDDLDR